jgi:CRP-like cAMP-binding protein/phosphoribosyl 1,2-cyclic phosphodiesterase
MENGKQTVVNARPLPRGGYLVETPGGLIQFGSPPETIKDTMRMDLGVPQVFILPRHFFNWIKGISVAEVEFPIYFNFFLKKRKTWIVCSEEQRRRFLKALREAVFGPENLDIRKDYTESIPENLIPDLSREIGFFRNNLKLEDLVEFILFENGRAEVNGVTVRIDDASNFEVVSEGKVIACVPGKIDYVPTYDIGKRLPEPYNPPCFGMTCLGPSHGFDPEESTSGFILWLNQKGIMIDPPVNSTEWLVDSNVNPKLIDSVILTHCHADHDAGTFQKILEEGKITVYTTATVMESFLKKYGAITDSTPDYLLKLFDFTPVKIGEPFFIHSGKFEFFYTLHSIPTAGFKVSYENKSMVYSSDHNGDPEIHQKLRDEKIITEDRYTEFSKFPWDSDRVYHEAGIPPLHTPIKFLNSMDRRIQQKIIVYHIAKKDFPEETRLTLARSGIENTQDFRVKAPPYLDAYQTLGLLNYLDFFQNMPIRKAQDFISIVREERFRKGDLIIRKGTIGDKFYIIKTGNVTLVSNSKEHKKVYGNYDYFGEVALITGQKRTADIQAVTDVVAWAIEKEMFLSFIAGTPFETALRRLAKIRDAESWATLSESSSFRILTSTQKTILESMIHRAQVQEPSVLLREGNFIDRLFILREGEIEISRGKKKIGCLRRGDYVGSVLKIYRSEPSLYTFRNTGPVSLYYVERDDMLRFLEQNPGLVMKLVYDFDED